VTIDIDHAAVVDHRSVAVESGQPGAGAGVEAAIVDLENLDDLSGDVIDERAGRRLAGGDGRGGAEHTGQVALLPAGAGLLATSPERHLGHCGADQDQQHRGLDVCAVGDGELVVGLGKKEVEPHRAGQGGDDAGWPDTGGSRNDDDED
jgi:hypothetical protein